MSEYKTLAFTDIIVQKIINRNISRSYWLMQGKGGYNTAMENGSCSDHKARVRSSQFAMSYPEFREEAKLESSLIYCEAVESYNPDYLIESKKGTERIRFTTWLYWKLRDLEARMYRLMSHGTKSLDHYVDTGKGNSFEAEFIFRDSLSESARELLALLETGKGFHLKKSRARDNANCHMGVRNFWETFIRDETKTTFNEFNSAWNEIRKAWNEIETDSMIYTIHDYENAM